MKSNAFDDWIEEDFRERMRKITLDGKKHGIRKSSQILYAIKSGIKIIPSAGIKSSLRRILKGIRVINKVYADEKP